MSFFASLMLSFFISLCGNPARFGGVVGFAEQISDFTGGRNDKMTN